MCASSLRAHPVRNQRLDRALGIQDLEPTIESAPVEQPGQRIALGEKFQLPVLLSDGGHVLQLPQCALNFAVAHERHVMAQKSPPVAQVDFGLVREVLPDQSLDAAELRFRIFERGGQAVKKSAPPQADQFGRM